jgi:hypothetical protein
VSNVQQEFVRVGTWQSPIFGILKATERPRGLRGITYRFRYEEPQWDPETFQSVEQDLDLFADATRLPIARGKLGALYARALHTKVEKSLVAHEAPRTLEPGGILVIERMKKATQAPDFFDVIASKKAGKGLVNLVLRRNNTPYNEEKAGVVS